MPGRGRARRHPSENSRRSISKVPRRTARSAERSAREFSGPTAADVFTVEVWGPRGLVTFYVFFLIELATRRIEIVVSRSSACLRGLPT